MTKRDVAEKTNRKKELEGGTNNTVAAVALNEKKQQQQQQMISMRQDIDRWLIRGDVARLEQLILEGKMHLLQGRTSPHVKTRVFLKTKNEYAGAVRGFLSAVVSGKLQAVREWVGYKRTVLAKHPVTRANALHLGAIWAQLDVLRYLVRSMTASINDRDIDGRTPLHYAGFLTGMDRSKGGFYDLLLAHGANDKAIDSEGYAPSNYLDNPELLNFEQVQGLNEYPVVQGDEVDELIAERNVSALESLILNGEYNKLNGRIFPPGTQHLERLLHDLKTRIRAVHEAIRDGDEATFKQLVDKKRLATSRDSMGRTPLHTAVICEQFNIANYLLLVFSHCVDHLDKKNRTALHYANCLSDKANRKKFETLLLSGGANKTLRDTDGHLPEFYQRHPKTAKKVYAVVSTVVDSQQSTDQHPMDTTRNGTGEQQQKQKEPVVNEAVEKELLEVAEKGDMRRLETMIYEGKGEQINKVARKHARHIPLFKLVTSFRTTQARLKTAMEAIDDADLSSVRQTVDKEQIAVARDGTGHSILHAAVFRERHDIAEYLAKTFRASMSVVDHNGRLGLHYAAAQPNAIYDTLLDAGADPHLADNDGITAEEYRRHPEKLPRPSSVATEATSIIGSGYAPSRIHDEPIHDPDEPSRQLIDEWLKDGETDHLEQLVLDGRGQLLLDKASVNPVSVEFLRALKQYQSKIDAIHKAVEEGDVRRVRSLIDRNQLATARDRNGLTSLHKAVLHGQTNTVRYLLARYSDIVNATDHAGRTAFHYAATDPNGDHFVKLLQKAGGDAFIEDKYGHTPFYYRTHPRSLNVQSLKDNAVINQLLNGELSRPLLQDLEEDITDWLHTGNIGKLEELVLNGYADFLLGRHAEVEDIDAVAFLEVLPQYQGKIQAIHLAIRDGNLRAVKLMTDRKKLALCRDSRGLTPLHNAIVFDKPDIAKYLIRNYPQSVNAMDHNKRTPLHYAAALRDGGYLYKMIRKAGADPTTIDCHGRPGKYYLRYPGEIDLVSHRMDTRSALKHVLHNRVAPSYMESNIQQWLRENNVAKLEQLVLSGCGDLLLDRETTHPETAVFIQGLGDYLLKIENVHKAVREGNLRDFKQLVDLRKLAMARDRKGCTPLHDAIVYEQTDIVRYIVSNFTNLLNAPDYNKRTAMHYAAAARDGGHYLKILAKAGADPMAVDNEGRTPDYYRRYPGILDLKQIQDRDKDSADLFPVSDSEMDENEWDRADSRMSDFGSTMSTFSDLLDVEEDVDGAARTAFEQVLNERVENELRSSQGATTQQQLMTENGLFLARAVGPVLTKALAEVVLRRPKDPIFFLSEWLHQYHQETTNRKTNNKNGSESKSNRLEVKQARTRRKAQKKSQHSSETSENN